MNIIKNMFNKVGAGALYGIGFGITFGAFYYFISEQMIDSVWNDDALEQISIKNHEKVNRDENVLILGSVENEGAESVRTLSIQVDLINKEGKFVEQCSTYLKGALKPGEKRNFKVICGDGKNKPVVEHETYKVYILGL